VTLPRPPASGDTASQWMVRSSLVRLGLEGAGRSGCEKGRTTEAALAGRSGGEPILTREQRGRDPGPLDPVRPDGQPGIGGVCANRGYRVVCANGWCRVAADRGLRSRCPEPPHEARPAGPRLRPTSATRLENIP